MSSARPVNKKPRKFADRVERNPWTHALRAAKVEAERTGDCAPIDAVVKRFRRARSSIATKHARAGLKEGGAAWLL